MPLVIDSASLPEYKNYFDYPEAFTIFAVQNQINIK